MGGQPLVTACMFCLLCATQSHCAGHHGASLSQSVSSPFLEAAVTTPHPHRRGKVKRTMDNDFVKAVFREFGEGEFLTKQGFVKLLESLGLEQDEESKFQSNSTTNSTHSSDDCLGANDMLKGEEALTSESYLKLCPAILYQLLPGPEGTARCHNHRHEESTVTSNQNVVWFYATLSVFFISLCGLLAVAVIPLMHKAMYKHLLQYLVALAIGTLCGDALLHLLPHAMMPPHGHGEHDHHHINSTDQHRINLLRGLTAVSSLVFFCFTEKSLSMITKLLKAWTKKRKEYNPNVRVIAEDRPGSSSRVGEKSCKHKYSHYPYCYEEIDYNHRHGKGDGENSKPEEFMQSKKFLNENNSKAKNEDKDEDNEEETAVEPVRKSRGTEKMYTTIILREHETSHHGHAHTHGHVHSAPVSLSSVALMVVMGDGLHNFTDGLAIGAAFAANIGGGVSTAVAVFCHELPHELGDFAVLLQAGMSAKQAVFYNVLSSVLCLLGMCLGILLGHDDELTQWVFAAAAGMFLYIALVDMVPELTSSHSDKGTFCQFTLQFCGMLTGISIMAGIAAFENDLKDAFKDSF